MSDLFKVAGPPGEPIASVLLVHGLQGHAYDTWRSDTSKRWHADKTFWPRWLVPLDWAGTQTNLGNALLALGTRESSTVRLEQAVAAFREALTEWTRERVPLRWALSTGNQGRADGAGRTD